MSALLEAVTDTVTNLARDTKRVSHASIRARRQLSVQAVVAAVELNPFSCELHLKFLEQFLISFGGCADSGFASPQCPQSDPYGDWLRKKYGNSQLLAYRELQREWPDSIAEREELIRNASPVLNKVMKEYISQARWPTPHPDVTEIWVSRLRSHLSMHAKLGDIFSLLGGLLAVERFIEEVEASILEVFPEVQTDLLWGYRRFKESKGFSMDVGLHCFKEGLNRTESAKTWKQLWSEYVSSLPR